MNEWVSETASLLGKRVSVTINKKGITRLVAEGRLLSFDEGGEFVIEADDGFVHYCWPMLDIKEVIHGTDS